MVVAAAVGVTSKKSQKSSDVVDFTPQAPQLLPPQKKKLSFVVILRAAVSIAQSSSHPTRSYLREKNVSWWSQEPWP